MIAGEHRLALPAGYQLGKYRFQSVLGAGGFGITYLAMDHSLDRRVAIKELLPNEIATRLDGSTVVAKTKSEEENLVWARDRFVKEGRALAACEHSSVVHVYEMIEANGTAYMVTKYEEGRSFAEWLKEVGGAPTEKELRAILLPLLSGLEKVHRSGFLHRDLKPENIYITDDGRPILLDFGSARQAVTDRTTSLTSIVTSGYAPFEQYHEDGKQGAWTDIYAMAAVMYRAIHGKKPPEATRRLKDDPCLKLAREYSGKYSAQFLTAIDKGLAVEYQKRPQSIGDWKVLLGSAPAETSVIPEPWWQEWLRNANPAWLVGGAAGVLLVGLIAVKLLFPDPVPVPVPDPPKPIPVTPGPEAVTPTPQPITPVPQPVTPAPEPATPVPITPVPQPATPPPAPATPTDRQTNVWDLWKNYVPGPTPFLSPPTPSSLTEVGDKRFIGTWTKEPARRSDPGLRWEIAADGRYTIFSGDTAIDAGTLTARTGNIHLTSDTTRETLKGTFQLKTATSVYIKGLPNGGTWKKARTASTEPSNEPDKPEPSDKPKPSSNNNTQTSTNKKPSNGSSSKSPSVEKKARDVINSFRRRLPF